MENKINKIITLSNSDRYMIMDQGNYNGKSYYLVCKVAENDELLEVFNILENDNEKITNVENQELFKALLEYFQKRNEKNS